MIPGIFELHLDYEQDEIGEHVNFGIKFSSGRFRYLGMGLSTRRPLGSKRTGMHHWAE
jgi:hypothetical protein